MVRSSIPLIILIVLVWAGATFMPMFKRVTADPSYEDFTDVDLEISVSYDATVPLHRYQQGDILVYQVHEEGTGRVCFGNVIAKPGEDVSVRNGQIYVNGESVDGYSIPRGTPERASIIIPIGHLFVISTYHEFDSFTIGPIPETAFYGRHGEAD